MYRGPLRAGHGIPSSTQGISDLRGKTTLRAGKNNKLNFLWPKMARLGPSFGPPKAPETVYVYVPLLRSFPGNEAHKLFFFWGPKTTRFWVGAKKFMLKSLCAFSVP